MSCSVCGEERYGRWHVETPPRETPEEAERDCAELKAGLAAVLS